MTELVLHATSRDELERGMHPANEWLRLIEQIHSKGFCSTFSLTPSEVFENEYKTAKNPHHSVGPTLEFTSIGKKTDANQWENAGWLCTFIKSRTEIFSFRTVVGPHQHDEYSIYTGVHIVESNCICSLEQLIPVLDEFLIERTVCKTENWLEFDCVFMTHDMYQDYCSG